MSTLAPGARGLAGALRPAVTALLLVAAALLCGLRLPEDGRRTLAFEAFGFVEGALALIVLFLLLRQRAIAAPAHPMERVALAYWLGATAVLLRLVLPPPGLGYWIGVVVLGAALLGAFGGGDRRRTVVTLGLAAVACATLRFAVIPFVWRNATLPDLGPIELGGVSDWAKGLVTEYEPVRPGNEALNVLGLALYALALWRSWPSDETDPIAALDPAERDRLLRALLARVAPVEALPAGREPAAGDLSPGPSRRRLPAASLLLGGEPAEPPGPTAPGAPVREPGGPKPGPREPPPPRLPDEPPGEEPPAPGAPDAPVRDPGRAPRETRG